MTSTQLEAIKTKFADHVRDLQERISQQLNHFDPKIELVEDLWKRKDYIGQEGGGGRTRAFQGQVFENAGVNTSLVHGKVNPKFGERIGASGPNSDEMWATGISLIIHPSNPKVPTSHANFRMIQAGEKFWFGGGADLTPYYPYEEDFEHFHKTWKEACDPYGSYDDMKKTCDEYFVNKHRDGEMRGIGGIFFDHLCSGDLEKDFNMVVDLSEHFIQSYFPLVEKRMGGPFTKDDEDFMLHRRGRYVEFNLLHDRGTMFGLQSNGRTDSILISLPARCKFTYRYTPKANSPHEKMMDYYRPRNWV